MNKKVEDLLFYLSWRVVNSPFFLCTGKIECSLSLWLITFHPDGDVGSAVVAPGALGGQEVAGRRLEPVPVLGQVLVTDGGPPAHAQVVVEASLRLARHQTIVTLETGVITRNQPEKVDSLHRAAQAGRASSWLLIFCKYGRNIIETLPHFIKWVTGLLSISCPCQCHQFTKE